jgi:phosphoribosylformimino-5-aminoimidazole carboxamide ribotide isomerase
VCRVSRLPAADNRNTWQILRRNESCGLILKKEYKRDLKMFILPAIDIKDGKCVRLYKGDFTTAHQVAESYLATAESFQAAGAEWIHMVDLDGAKDKKPVNEKIFIEVAAKTNLKVEVGGGIRTLDTIDFYLENGISRVILGSVALTNKELVEIAVKKYGEKIAVGIDTKDGYAAADGWLQTSKVHYSELFPAMIDVGVKTFIFTDISKDGTLEGLPFDDLKKISELTKAANNGETVNIIASGGVKDMSDIEMCKDAEIYGVIVGKAIYSGNIDLKKAVDFSKN